MKAELIGIGDRGNLERERVGIRVLVQTDMKYFVVLASTASGMGISNIPRRTYWLTPLEAAPGDIVVLFTRKGTQTSVKQSDGHTFHYYFWNLDTPIWADEKIFPVLLELSAWERLPAPPTPKRSIQTTPKPGA